MTSVTNENGSEVWNNVHLYTSTTDCSNEEVIEFQGKIPEWLKGTLYRNGPGANEVNNDPTTSVNHAFDGFAFIQKYNIDGSQQNVRFRASFTKSRAYTEALKQGQLVTRQFGTDPCKSIFGRFQSLFRGREPTTFTDDTGVTIQIVNKELLALTETVMGNVIDQDTLDLVGPLVSLPYAQSLDAEIMSTTTAHVMYDEKRKMTVGYSGRITRKGHWLDVVFIHDDQQSNEENKENTDEDIAKSIASNNSFLHITQNMNQRALDYNRRIKANTKLYRFPYQAVCYMHSASITEDYLILAEIPFHFNTFYAIWNSLAGGAITDMFKWNGETMPTYFRIISLDTGEQLAYIPGPAFFTFHHVNAYQTKENPKKINVDICAYDDHRLINELYINKLRENVFPSGAGYIRRFQLDLDAMTCTEPNANAREPKGGHCFSYAHSLVPVQFELPRLNPKFIGKPYRYMYGVRSPPGRLLDAVVKFDVETNEQVAIWEEACTSPSEPIFVPRPDANDDQEDDGIILTVILDQRTKRSFLLVLDAANLKELGRAFLPVHIPLSFHGNFY